MTSLLQAIDVRACGNICCYSVLCTCDMHNKKQLNLCSGLLCFAEFWQLSVVCSTRSVYSFIYLMNAECSRADIHRCTASAKCNGEHCLVMHSSPKLCWGLSKKKKESAEALQEWRMLVCQFVTKAVCSCVIDWQTLLAQYPQGHTGNCYRLTFF